MSSNMAAMMSRENQELMALLIYKLYHKLCFKSACCFAI
jgi:hypothetical protein